MPNWKTYESSVRLLSAIVAANPGMKLDYAETAACMGSDVTKKALEWQFSVTLKKNAQLIKDARAAGRDCKDLNLTMGGSASSKKC